MSDKKHHIHYDSSHKDTLHHDKNNHATKISREIKKRKIGLFYKINFSIVLFISLILLYFIILVSAEPKSFPYITTKIESYLKENFSKDVKMDKAYISFTPYGSFKISVNNLRINKSNSDNSNEKNHEFEIPLIEGEFPLYKVLLLRFTPQKIKITKPTILFYPKENIDSDSDNSEIQNPLIYSAPLIGFLSAIKKDNLNIKIFEMENLKFILKHENKPDTTIILKKSNIKVEAKNRVSSEALQISSSNIINFNNGADINLNANCKFNPEDTTICNVALANLSTSSISALNPAFNILNQINTTINSTATLTIKDQQIRNLTFKADAKNGYFDLPQFFSKKISFSNLSLKGDYNNEIDALNLAAIDADLNPDQKKTAGEKHLSMSLFITNLQNLKNKKLNFFIKLANVPTHDVEAFWPVSLPGQDIRKWVIGHVSGGKIENAFAKFSLITNDGTTDLEDIDSQMTFTDLNLNYDEYFPNITALKGVASFTKNQMNIAVSSGNVLSSKIFDAHIAIKDFNAPITMLDIDSNFSGNASDGLKHANYKSIFSTEIEKYFSGNNSNGNFNIKIPLQEKILLKDIYISANQKINGFKNDYIDGDISLATTKNFNSNSFVSSVDLTTANLNAKVFDIEKKPTIAGGLDFIISVGDNNLLFKNINLWKKEEITENKKTSTINSKISGDFILDLEPLTISTLNLKNYKFGKNDYAVSYKNDEKKKSQKISINGNNLNLTSFLQNQLPFTISADNSDDVSLKVSIDKVWLVNKKSLNKLNIALNSTNGIYFNSFIKANYGKLQNINFSTIPRKPKENFTTINGLITDVGYIAEGLNISNTIAGGNAKIKIANQLIDNKPAFIGEVKIDNDIIFYENNSTKRLAKNTLFSNIKDSIFSNNKTTFDSVKINFTLNNKNLILDSLIANNYKIGITAKGSINLANNSYDIKGMIIPGFVINNLFGIGKIPLIGGMISGILTGGEGGGLFGIKYEYKKLPNQKEATFETNKVSAFVPVSIRNLFDSI